MTTKRNNDTKAIIRISCRDCRHYYVTWDENFPHGCKAMKFKSRRSPAYQVKATSGMDCLLFQDKKH